MQLATHFDGYQQIPKIAEIRKTIDSINTQLNEQISKAFSEISDMASGVAEPGQLRREDAAPGSFKSLAEACKVVDALGPEARKVHVDDFCRKQLDPYPLAFPKGGEVRQPPACGHDAMACRVVAGSWRGAVDEKLWPCLRCLVRWLCSTRRWSRSSGASPGSVAR